MEARGARGPPLTKQDQPRPIISRTLAHSPGAVASRRPLRSGTVGPCAHGIARPTKSSNARAPVRGAPVIFGYARRLFRRNAGLGEHVLDIRAVVGGGVVGAQFLATVETFPHIVPAAAGRALGIFGSAGLEEVGMFHAV